VERWKCPKHFPRGNTEIPRGERENNGTNGAGSRKKRRKRSRNRYPASVNGARVDGSEIHHLAIRSIKRSIHTRVHARASGDALGTRSRAVDQQSRSRATLLRRRYIARALLSLARNNRPSMLRPLTFSPSASPRASQLSLLEHLVPQRGWQSGRDDERGPSSSARGGPAL